MSHNTLAEINRSISTKKVDHFHVSFLRLDENTSNILGREIISIERPTINFMEFEMRNKGIKSVGEGTIEYQQISIQFHDDDQSLVNKCLYEQIKRQTYVSQPKIEIDTITFDVLVKVFSTNDKLVEQFTLKDCYINSLSHSEQIYSDSTNNIITVTISFNELDYVFPVLDE